MLFASANDGCQLEGGFAFGLFDKYGPRAAVGQMEEGCFVAVVDAQCHAVGHSAVPTEGHNLAFGGVCAVGGETYCLLAHSTLWVNLLAKIQTKSVPDTPTCHFVRFSAPKEPLGKQGAKGTRVTRVTRVTGVTRASFTPQPPLP